MATAEVNTFLQVLLIILVTARVFAELAARMKSPTVIGELIAGVVLGPSLLGWIEPYEAIKLLAEIGIILLLFEVGLQGRFTWIPLFSIDSRVAPFGATTQRSYK
jgi:Kef-type K+ transport system membrane component KefB